MKRIVLPTFLLTLMSLNTPLVRANLYSFEPVTGINGGSSDSYVMKTIVNPVPGAFLLGFLGLASASVKLKEFV
jgi:hypothetical protein